MIGTYVHLFACHAAKSSTLRYYRWGIDLVYDTFQSQARILRYYALNPSRRSRRLTQRPCPITR